MTLLYIYIFFNPYPRTWVFLILERGRRWGDKEREGEKRKKERENNQLPPVRALGIELTT